ncbi:MAG: hypothetical protein U0Q03_20535 [Acidimicrobiales bacterium]
MDRDALLCELTLDGRREAVLALVPIEEVARQWVVYTAREAENDDVDDPQHWPLWFRYECLRNDDDCREFLVALTNAPGADAVAHVIGAGLMEDTLRFDEAGLT